MLALGTAAALLLTACAGAQGTPNGQEGDLPPGVSLTKSGAQALERNKPVTGGTLTVALNAAAESLDPMYLGQVAHAAWSITHAIYDPLLRYDDSTQNIVGYLAESFESDDDGATWTLKLPRGVKFHDGTDFNAAAVAAHFERIGGEGSTSSAARDARNFATIEVRDDTTLHLTLATPNPLLPNVLVSSVLGLVPSPTAVQQLGRDFGMKPVGTGPFMVESFMPASDARVVRNPDYRIKGLPYLDAIEFVTATDNQAQLSAALAGDIDLATTQNAVDMDRAQAGGLTPLYQPSYTYFNIVFSMSKPPFDDVRFRKAVIQGIDLDALNNAVYGGKHEVMTGIFPKSNPYYVETDWPSFDPESAKKLIKEWQADTGNEPEFLLTSFAPTDFQKQAAMIQQMLADIGVTMNIEVREQATMVSEALSDNYQAQLRWTGLPPEITQDQINQFSTGSALNIGHIGDAEVDQLLEDLKVAKDADERADLFEELQHRYAEWLPMIPTIRQVVGWYVSDKVGGFPGMIPGMYIPDMAHLYIAE